MSTAPQPYERQANFTSFEQVNPTRPKPGASLDAEFNAIRALANALLTRLSEIQRDDGQLRNSSVQPDTLSTDTLLLIGSSITPRGNWSAGVVYRQRDLVQQSGVSYLAVAQHVSGTFSADLSAGRWQALNSATAAVNIPFSPSGGLLSTNVQNAIAEVQGNVGGRQPAAEALTQLSGIGLLPNSFPYVGPSGTYLFATSSTIGRIIMGAATPEAVRLAAGITSGEDPFDYVQLDSLARLPPVDGSQLFNVPVAPNSVGESQLANTLNLSSKSLTLPPSLTPALTLSYTSPQQTISNAGGATLAHGLGGIPSIIQVFLVCVTAEQGFSVGERILWGSMYQSFDRGAAVSADATNLYYRYVNQSTPFSYINKTTGATAALTNANWRMVIRAFA